MTRSLTTTQPVCTLSREADHDHDHEQAHRDEQERDHDHDRQRAAALGRSLLGRVDRALVSVAASGVALAAGFAGSWLGWPSSLTTSLFLLAILAGATEIVPRGLKGLIRDRSLDINFLITLAVAGAMLLGEWSEGATVVFLFSLGEALETLTLQRTRRSIQALMAIAPETARVKEADGSQQIVRVEDVAVGRVFVVRPGDRIPLDGLIVAGRSDVDQAPITGESAPADKAEGDAVFAGTINGSGYLEVRSTKPFAENTLSRIIHLVETAQSEKAPSQRFVERFARVYTPVVVVAAVLLAIIPPLVLGEPVAPWFNRALVMLLIACPCALVIATPVAVVAAIGNASRNGVLIKGGAYLERAGALRAVAFDKTGTLTRGVPEVTQVTPLNGLAGADVLRLAAALESRSEHPLGEAIVRADKRAGSPDQPTVEDFRAVVGSGAQGTIDGTSVLVGKPKWLEAAGFRLDAARPALDELALAGQTAVVVGRGPIAGAGSDSLLWEAVGVIGVADQLRDAAPDAVAALRRGGVQRVVMLSGDTAATARAVAAQTGIRPQDVYAELLPEDKVAAIRELVRDHGAVAMVGDGVNDAPALAAATVGIAMGAGGSDTALETADVALVGDDLTRLAWVLDLSRRASRTIKLNVALALLSKLVVIVLAVMGYANLWLAIATDTGATVLVILHSMRLLGRIPRTRQADVDAARRRYGLAEADAHDCHDH